MDTDANKPIRLDGQEWLAIYYGLSAAQRELDRDRQAGIWDETLAAYYEFLQAIQAHIGDEGEDAHRRGTRGVEDPTGRWVHRDIVERIRDRLSEN